MKLIRSELYQWFCNSTPFNETIQRILMTEIKFGTLSLIFVSFDNLIFNLDTDSNNEIHSFYNPKDFQEMVTNFSNTKYILYLINII